MTEDAISSNPINSEPVPLFLQSFCLESTGRGLRPVSADSENSNMNKVGDDISNRLRMRESTNVRLPSSPYKGVVTQPNGRWGSQLYEKHQRVWLGTFSTEEEAAKAYDRAVFRFRGNSAITNLVNFDDAHPESLFLRGHSKAEIVDMIQKHTYEDELEQSIQNANANHKIASKAAGSNLTERDAAVPHEHLFEKVLTTSDVGKLKRLVIPRYHAEKHFPRDVVSSRKVLLLNFEDGASKIWHFRYVFWNSSQSYVLTKGWNRYVKEKRLQAGDVVSFGRSNGGSGKLYINFRRRFCNVLLTGLHTPAWSARVPHFLQVVSPFEGYCHFTDVFFSPTSVQERAIGHSSIPLAGTPNSFSSYDLFESPSSMRSATDHGEPARLEFLSPERQNNSSSSSSSCGVMLFGVNLCESSSANINPFPSVRPPDYTNNCEDRQQWTKQKAEDSLGFYGAKKHCH